MVNVGFWGSLGEGKTKALTKFGLECFESGYEIEGNYAVRFPSRTGSWSGNEWRYPGGRGRMVVDRTEARRMHLTDFVDPKTGQELMSMDGLSYLIQEAYSELDGRLFGSQLNRCMTYTLNQVAKGGTSVGWDAPRFEDPDIRLRTVTGNSVMCIEADEGWIELWANTITWELVPEIADKDVVSLIGQCYNTRERNPWK